MEVIKLENKKVGLVVNPDTGEIINEINAGDRLLRKTSVEYLNNTQDWKMENFFKGHTGEIGNWIKDLSVNERAFLFSIVPHIGYEDCCIKYSNGRPLGTEDLVKVTYMPRSTVYEVLVSLTKKDILYRGKNSKERQFFINPWLFCKGSRINKVIRTMFRNYRIRVLGGVKWKNL
jgi:hypothetical protein